MGLWKRLFGGDTATAKSEKPLSILSRPPVLPLKEEVESFMASESGDRDQLNRIIKRCTEDEDGLSLLRLARQGIQPQWHALRKDLDTAIEQFPVKKDDPPAGPIVWMGDNVPKQLRDDFIHFAMTPRALDDLKVLVWKCKAYSNGKQLLEEVLEIFKGRYRSGHHSELIATLEASIEEWVAPSRAHKQQANEIWCGGGMDLFGWARRKTQSISDDPHLLPSNVMTGWPDDHKFLEDPGFRFGIEIPGGRGYLLLKAPELPFDFEREANSREAPYDVVDFVAVRAQTINKDQHTTCGRCKQLD